MQRHAAEAVAGFVADDDGAGEEVAVEVAARHERAADRDVGGIDQRDVERARLVGHGKDEIESVARPAAVRIDRIERGRRPLLRLARGGAFHGAGTGMVGRLDAELDIDDLALVLLGEVGKRVRAPASRPTARSPSSPESPAGRLGAKERTAWPARMRRTRATRMGRMADTR
jgi:hypothetical protein